LDHTVSAVGLQVYYSFRTVQAKTNQIANQVSGRQAHISQIYITSPNQYVRINQTKSTTSPFQQRKNKHSRDTPTSVNEHPTT
jgi:hypothetical protein